MPVTFIYWLVCFNTIHYLFARVPADMWYREDSLYMLHPRRETVKRETWRYCISYHSLADRVLYRSYLRNSTPKEDASWLQDSIAAEKKTWKKRQSWLFDVQVLLAKMRNIHSKADNIFIILVLWIGCTFPFSG